MLRHIFKIYFVIFVKSFLQKTYFVSILNFFTHFKFFYLKILINSYL